MKKQIVLNDLNYVEWVLEKEIELETLGLRKHVKYGNFDAYFITLEKSRLEKEYIRERQEAIGANDGETEDLKKEVDKSWQRERRKFMSEEDEMRKKWFEGEEKTIGQIKKSVEKSFLNEIKDIDTAFEM